jgi:predicted Zn-dependent protease with MMP-like domain
MVKEGTLSDAGFERLVEKSLANLPREFQSYLENVVVIIEDEPPDDMPDVMGLYEGVPLVERSIDDTMLPDCITLFKGPIERVCHTRAEIEAEVRVTVLHEVGHFFGLEEEQVEHL